MLDGSTKRKFATDAYLRSQNAGPQRQPCSEDTITIPRCPPAFNRQATATTLLQRSNVAVPTCDEPTTATAATLLESDLAVPAETSERLQTRKQPFVAAVEGI
jgi:hypothetical protein